MTKPTTEPQHRKVAYLDELCCPVCAHWQPATIHEWGWRIVMHLADGSRCAGSGSELQHTDVSAFEKAIAKIREAAEANPEPLQRALLDLARRGGQHDAE